MPSDLQPPASPDGLHQSTESLLTQAIRARKVTDAPAEPAATHEFREPAQRSTFAGYELLRRLGRGGMGVVWLARNPRTRHRVALKLIHTGADANPGEVERFLTEARAGARLYHPHIVNVLHFGTADGQPFFTMELLSGVTLRDRLRRGPLSPRDAARLIRQAALAIQHAHENRVLHRDLTPGNLILTGPAGEADADDGARDVSDAALGVKVSDFGLARLQDATQHLTRTGDQIGTPSYMAPEQASGDVRRQDERTDVYGLGAVLYASLTGRPPFQAATPVETLLLAREHDPVAIRTLVPGTPRALEAVCLKCLEKDPRRRYATAGQLADDLGRWLEDKPVLARPAGPVERAARWARRNAAVASLAAAVLLSLVAGVVASGYFAVTAWQEAQATREAEGVARSEKERADEALTLANEQLDRAERAVYVGQLTQSRHEFQGGSPAKALQLLSAALPRFRGIEHSHLWTTFNALRSMEGHQAAVQSVAYSPDGRRIVSASQDGTARVWDAATGKGLLTLTGHVASVWSACFRPAGQRIYTASVDRTLGVWDANTGRRLRTLFGHKGGVLAVAVSRDGQRLLSGGMDRSVRLWDAESGAALGEYQFHTNFVTGVAFHPDGEQFVSGSWDFRVRLWRVGVSEPRAVGVHGSRVLSVAFSPDGKRIASGGNDQCIKVWDVETGKPHLNLEKLRWAARGVAFSSDGKRLAGAIEDGTVNVWDADTGREVFALKGHTLPASSVAFSPDGKRLVSGSGNVHENTRPGEVKLWDAERGQGVPTLTDHGGTVIHVSFDRPGRRFVSTSYDKTAKVWSADGYRVLRTLTGHAKEVRSACFGPEGAPLITGDGDGVILGWDAESGSRLFSLKGHSTSVHGLAYRPDGSEFLSASGDGSAKVWDAATRKERFALKGHTQNIWSAAYSPDGNRIVTAACQPFKPNQAGEVKLWDADTGRESLAIKGLTCPVFRAVFSPEGDRIYSGGYDGNVRVWDALTGEELLTLKGHSMPVKGIQFTPDGRRVITCAGDHTNPGKAGEVKIWDAVNGQELLSLMGHTKAVDALAVSPDGTRILSGDWDAKIKVWEATSRLEGQPR